MTERQPQPVEQSPELDEATERVIREAAAEATEQARCPVAQSGC